MLAMLSRTAVSSEVTDQGKRKWRDGIISMQRGMGGYWLSQYGAFSCTGTSYSLSLEVSYSTIA